MGESTAGPGAGSGLQEFTSALTGFDVVDRDGERIGTVSQVNLARTCMVVESGGSLFRRKQSHVVHIAGVDEIDLDGFTVTLGVTAAHVEAAPEFHEFVEECETAVARHYGALG